MKVARSLPEIHLLFAQYKRETRETKFDLNKLIKWLGDRVCIEVDDDLVN